ncbi:MAG: methylthioribose-1-phosphate isomerase [Planctomycetota bacterium]|jgi:methylthioribose-1-phosphate isomerase
MRNPTIIWHGDANGHATLIDQTLLPGELRYIEIRDKETMWDAIKRLAIRGAPAIGVAAAYGVVLGLQKWQEDGEASLDQHLEETCDYLASSRPTAVNLFWALDRLSNLHTENAELSPPAQVEAIFKEACQIQLEDQLICDELGRIGAELVKDQDVLITHCNAGALATAGSGTALSVMFHAHEAGRAFRVFVDETRPLLQGARLTAWELKEADIDATLICDNMAAHAMKTQGISRVFVGSDRIAANGDAANKIGTYGLAVLAKAHNVPFYVVAPKSTFDLSLAGGDEIPIEERDPAEITIINNQRCTPEGMKTWSPAFDVTPAALITGIVTEKGIITPVTTEEVRRVLNS